MREAPAPKKGFLLKTGGGTKLFGSTAYKRRFFELELGVLTWCAISPSAVPCASMRRTDNRKPCRTSDSPLLQRCRRRTLPGIIGSCACRKQDDKADNTSGSVHVLSILEAAQRHGLLGARCGSPPITSSFLSPR